MTWILDTDSCIYLLREQLPALTERLRSIDPANIALTVGATLVTNDQREFTRVPELQVENWVLSAQ